MPAIPHMPGIVHHFQCPHLAPYRLPVGVRERPQVLQASQSVRNVVLEEAISRSLRSAGSRLTSLPVIATAAVAVTIWAFALGGIGPIIVASVGGALVVLAAAKISHREDRELLIRILMTALVAKSALMLALHLVLLERGFGGAMFQDDAGYPALADIYARHWRGEDVVLPTDVSVISSYVMVISATALFLGPGVVTLKMLSVVMSVAAAMFLYFSARTIAGRSVGLFALGLALVFPSLTLWGSLVLKDSYVLLLTLMAVWAATEFVRTSRAGWLLAAMAAIWPLNDGRVYMFMVLVIALPLAVALASLAERRIRIVPLLLTVLVSMSYLSVAASHLTIGTLGGLDVTRSSMAEGARSAFVERTATVTGEVGDRMVVVDPTRTTDPARTPNVVVVAPGTALVMEGRTTEVPEGAVVVRPGDIVVIGSASAATPPPLPVVVPSGGSLRIETAEQASDVGSRVKRSLGHLPVGLAYVIGAPFPWTLRTAEEVALLPELATWYAAVALGTFGLIDVLRRRLGSAAYVALVGLGVAAVLALIEGNVGTLVRHRAMLIPFAIVLAGIGLSGVPAWRSALARYR